MTPEAFLTALQQGETAARAAMQHREDLAPPDELIMPMPGTLAHALDIAAILAAERRVKEAVG